MTDAAAPPREESDGSAAARAADRFELDRASDYEHERLLMYRVILAFEIVAAIVLIREIALGRL